MKKLFSIVILLAMLIMPATAYAQSSPDGIWISQSEINVLPMTGPGWTELKQAADASPGSVSLSNQDSNNNTSVMAEALVFARTGNMIYRDKVISALSAITNGHLENGSRALALGRELAAYVISADIINLKTVNPGLDAAFRVKIKGLLTFKTTGGPANLIACDESRPNNWGGHCSASRVAVDLYLGDMGDLARAATVFHGWLGDRGSYAGFTYGALDWQANKTAPVGINPIGATIQGHDVSGSEPEEMRRAGSFVWPPKPTDYAWEGLQGRIASAKMLSRAGYPVWDWNDKALLRAVQFLYNIGWPAVGDDKWQIYIVDKVYGATFPKSPTGGHGKNVGWTAWTDQ